MNQTRNVRFVKRLKKKLNKTSEPLGIVTTIPCTNCPHPIHQKLLINPPVIQDDWVHSNHTRPGRICKIMKGNKPCLCQNPIPKEVEHGKS